MELSVMPLTSSVGDLDLELCEHKGLGHPDTICDALAERLSVVLCEYYIAHGGTVLHHNVDKALLLGGAARAAFCGGEVLAPIEIHLAGRATLEVEGARVPIEEIARESAVDWLREHLHALDPMRHVKLHCLARPGSHDLVDVYRRRTEARLANDTSLGAGYAPLSPLERAVLAAARVLRTMSTDPATPEVGEDVKVMGIRRGDRARLTVSCAFVGRYLRSLADYAASRARVAEGVAAAARAESGLELEVEVNAADDLARGSVFLTVTGTCAEAGDDGQVGRGNRVNGLITPMRPMTLEAAAGKNPVTHVGKLYNLLAHAIAASLVAELPGVAEAHCHLVSRIGHPIGDPPFAGLRLRTVDGRPAEELAAAAESVVRDRLARIDELTERIVAGRIAVV
jgi:S-adenosylmethionine synthetase